MQLHQHLPGVPDTDRPEWRKALANSLPVFLSAAIVSTLVIGLFYYWFAVADRYAIFLYEHLRADPFDPRTVSRYWMSGLVASGIVLVFYSVANWFIGRIAGVFYRTYLPPDWWRVWGFCAIPISAGIVVITTTRNAPTLPFPVALLCAAVALLGLGPALYAGSMTAQALTDLFWLLAVGAGLAPCLLLLRAVELPATGLVSGPGMYLAAVGGTLLGIAWSMVVIWSQPRLRKKPHRGSAGQFLVMAVCWSYLLLPAFHYWVLTPPGARYITVSANFFALNGLLQLAVFLVAALAAVGLARWQRLAFRITNS